MWISHELSAPDPPLWLLVVRCLLPWVQDRLLHFYKQTAICARDYESNSSEQVGVHYSLVLTF